MSTTTAGHLPESEVYDILRNDRRRSVIESLQDTGGTGTVGDLADRIAAIEAGETPPPRNVRQSVYVSLHQTHLPRLDEAGIVAFDVVANEVRLLDGAEEVTALLGTPPVEAELPPQTTHYYLGLATLGCLLVLGSLFGVPLFVVLSAVQWALASLVAIAVVAAVDLYRAGRLSADVPGED